MFLALLAFIVFPPLTAHAGTLASLSGKVKSLFLKAEAQEPEETLATSQTMALFKPVVVDSTSTEDENTDKESLQAVTGSLRVSTEDIDFPLNDTISVYEVKKGDSLATVASLFGVSKNTIIWANDLKSEKITPGQTIIILPITGVRHTVKSGDSITSIAKKYKGDVDDIAKYNGIAADAKLAAGEVVIVPAGEIAAPTIATVKKKTTATSKLLDSYTNAAPSGSLIRPVVGGRRSQGLHGHNGIDIAANVGTPILASGDGVVIVARSSGYNGGYGQMIIISHANNVQTVYGHLSQVNVVAGQRVSQGEVIGAVGNTGKSTGPHLHFEVRGAKNPF